MQKGRHYLISLPVLVVLVICVVGTPFVEQATSIEFFVNVDELDDYIPGDIIIVEPKNTTYVNVVPLNFVAKNGEFKPTSVYYNYPIWGPWYSYSIDGQANVTIPVEASLDITLTNLDSGEHCIVVYSYFYVAWGQIAPFCQSSETVYFSVVKTGISNTLILSILGATMIIAIGTIIVITYKKGDIIYNQRKRKHFCFTSKTT
ncbi:MAG: hypothetical protein LBB87_05730 [Nitrososphaerota archaeon]|jgi:hypothetical protein|nr:hypothetical protein [Nitrososphaerota archaeon]